MGAWGRVLAMAAKELAVVLRDRRVLTTLVASPVIQLVLFSMATTLEVRNVAVGLVNRDTGVVAEQFLAGLAASPRFGAIRTDRDERALAEAIEHREVLAGLVLPPDLSARVARDERAEIGLLLDGRRINTAQVTAAYISEIAGATGLSLRADSPRPPDLVIRNLFNPNLDYSWFTLPGMIAVITSVLVISVSAQAIAREREFGTYDQLMVLPLRAWQILLGKAVPAFLVGLFNGSFYVTMVALFSEVPFRGSFGFMLLAIAAFSLAATGIGLAISSIAANQQQAFLGGFLITVPMILLSGYATPTDGMPGWLQLIAAANPLSHMLAISHGSFLKGLSPGAAADHLWPILLAALLALLLAHELLRRHRD